jgi:hypothetical protein
MKAADDRTAFTASVARRQGLKVVVEPSIG